jgi:spore coat polysaccharide biosynthesis protein SpsF
MKLAAVLACRNESLRLYAKPLQYLDVKNRVSILDYMISQLKTCKEIEDIVLAISEEDENNMYKKRAKENDIPYVLGDDNDVLSRLIKGAELVNADHVFRVTTESPYTYLDNLSNVYKFHCDNNVDYSGLKEMPDGAYYEIFSIESLRRSWIEGNSKHRSEYCDSYIADNKDKFKRELHDVPEQLRRTDIRLTVDWPEDLIVMREIYEKLNLNPNKRHSLYNIIQFLDDNPQINSINNWIDSGIGRVRY